MFFAESIYNITNTHILILIRHMLKGKVKILVVKNEFVRRNFRKEKKFGKEIFLWCCKFYNKYDRQICYKIWNSMFAGKLKEITKNKFYFNI